MHFLTSDSKDDIAHLEAMRREQKTMDTTPLAPIMLDYAMAGTLIDTAVTALNEALPVGQHDRAQLAYKLLTRGVSELGVWMRARGYDV